MNYFKILNFTALLSLSLTTQGFAIPDDMDVAIVGGGLSGLRAAKSLQKKGENYGLFEARDRWGGRTYSETSNDHIFNMGGEWIDSDHKEMHALAKELHVALQKETFDAPIRILFGDRELSAPEKVTFLKRVLAKLKTIDVSRFETFSTSNGDIKTLSEILPDSFTPDERIFVECYLKIEEGLDSEKMSACSLHKLKEDLKEYLDGVVTRH